MAAGMGIMSKEKPEGLETSHKYNAGLLPFWHFNCGVGQGEVALTSWVSMVVSQACLVLLIFKIVANLIHPQMIGCTPIRSRHQFRITIIV